MCTWLIRERDTRDNEYSVLLFATSLYNEHLLAGRNLAYSFVRIDTRSTLVSELSPGRSLARQFQRDDAIPTRRELANFYFNL